MDAVFEKLLHSVLNEEGYGGTVWHEAYIDGWRLVMTQTDWGEVLFSARKDGEFFGFESWGSKWIPFLRGTKKSDLEWLVELAERAEWREIPEDNDNAEGEC